MSNASSLQTLDLTDLSGISGGMRYSPTDCQSTNVEDRRPNATPTPSQAGCTTSINPDVKLPPQQPLPLPTFPFPK
ncbi:MAG: hypothetical protein IPI49_21840 [Myxococcales bacterium]|nr:hypothetical protein [Myxococcales bacterium]